MSDHKTDQRKYSRYSNEVIFDYIGTGYLGGKAAGLVQIQTILGNSSEILSNDQISISIPRMTVIRTDIFDEFMQENDLYSLALSSDDDVYIAHAFQKGSLPAAIVGDLRNLISKTDHPLAIRSSSLLEDSSEEPFAGVYATKMLPNNQQDVSQRFHKLVEAIKFVYSSLFFTDSKDYFRITGKALESEKMAVIIQDVAGNRYNDNYYPLISGVGRSYNYYPLSKGKPEDGVVNLALGLGKTIVDGGSSWLYCPRNPKAPAPYNSIKELLDNSQRDFWSIKMGKIKGFNPISETEFIQKHELLEAEEDGNLALLVSTYDQQNDRLMAGMHYPGARLLDFAPVLKYEKIALNKIISDILVICREAYKSHIEIEFAVSKELNKNKTQYKFNFLQVRTMQVNNREIDIDHEYTEKDVIAISESVLGNGKRTDISDIVYVKPDSFNAVNSREIAQQIAVVNRQLSNEKKPYLLIGFGRWGSSDPWLGIPVTWSMISSARAIIEATLPQMKPDLSQGSHFFHNLIAFGIFYLSIQKEKKKSIDWQWLEDQEVISETEYIKHVRSQSSLKIIADCVQNRGIVLK